MSFLRFLFLPVCFLLSIAGADAALVRTDLLAVIGDFEQSTINNWWSSYKGADFDPDKYGVYVIPERIGGYSLPTENDSVADGWMKATSENINPVNAVVCRISKDDGLLGSNCQYIALKSISSGIAIASIDKHIRVDNSRDFCLHTGDTVTFKIDHVRMSGYDRLPQGSSVSYHMSLGCLAATKELKATKGVSSYEITAVVPPGVDDVDLQMYVRTSGNIGLSQPGIYIDGAHLLVKRSGEPDYEMKRVPVQRARSINTQNVFFHNNWTDIYSAARDYDALCTHEDEYASIPLLRFLNPKIKIYLYQTGSTGMDRHDSPEFTQAGPFNYWELESSYSQWLYKNTAGAGFVNDKTYPDRYYLRITSPAYQELWLRRVIEKARRLKVDGIWVDDLCTLTNDIHGVDRPVWEVQQFMHAVYPKLKAAGLEVVQNASIQHLDGRPGWAGNNGGIYFDPFWTPTVEYPASKGFSANTPENTADVFFQENALFISRPNENYFEEAYWLKCLDDMDTIYQWNTASDPQGALRLKESQRKRMHVWVVGRDRQDSPAYGVNGWINFGLCSFLLAQNEWTYVGFKVEKDRVGVSPLPYPDVDYSVTAKLGTPAGGHRPIDADPYFRYRLYEPNNPDSVGGVVVVNAHKSETRVYKTSFNAVDGTGHSIAGGTSISLPPNTGRILLRDIR